MYFELKLQQKYKRATVAARVSTGTDSEFQRLPTASFYDLSISFLSDQQAGLETNSLLVVSRL